MSSTADRSRRHRRQVHLRLDDEQLRALQALAEARDTTMTAALRLAVASAVEAQRGRPGDAIAERMTAQLRSLSHAAVGSLVAAEHTRLVVERFLGRHQFELLEGLEVEAAGAARRRLIDLEAAEVEL